jgi:hypothetical protein
LELTKDSTITLFTVTVQASSYKFNNLDSAQDFTVRIKVSNLVGDSAWSDYIPATTGIEPTRPGLITFVSSTRTSLLLQWELLVGADTGGTND